RGQVRRGRRDGRPGNRNPHSEETLWGFELIHGRSRTRTYDLTDVKRSVPEGRSGRDARRDPHRAVCAPVHARTCARTRPATWGTEGAQDTAEVSRRVRVDRASPDTSVSR